MFWIKIPFCQYFGSTCTNHNLLNNFFHLAYLKKWIFFKFFFKNVLDNFWKKKIAICQNVIHNLSAGTSKIIYFLSLNIRAAWSAQTWPVSGSPGGWSSSRRRGGHPGGRREAQEGGQSQNRGGSWYSAGGAQRVQELEWENCGGNIMASSFTV